MKHFIPTIALFFLSTMACTFFVAQGPRNAEADELLVPFKDPVFESRAKIEIHKRKPDATENEIKRLTPRVIDKFQEGAIEQIKGAQIGLNLLNNVKKRGQHPKNLGCVSATFEVITPMDQSQLHVGIFNPTKAKSKYHAAIRFSKGANNHDGQADSYGMAVKLFGVEGVKMLAEEQGANTQDFLLSSHPVFTAPNPRMLLKFVQAGLAGKKGLTEGDPDSPYYERFLQITHASRIVIKSPLDLDYWSQTPYDLGSNAVKYRIVHKHENVTQEIPYFKNDLRHAMEQHLTKLNAQAIFEFQIESWVGDDLPMEDPTKNWSEDCKNCTKVTPVAKLTISPQVFLTPEAMAFCEQLSFTPWHSLIEHEPLGQINRARKVVYQLGSQLRHVVNRAPRKEPAWRDYEIGSNMGKLSFDLAEPFHGWTREGQDQFYHTPQGTQILPFTWFLALKQMGREKEYVIDDANISRWGLLPDARNRYGLPVGFAKSEQPDKKRGVYWLDLTCAACHTGQLHYRGKIVRIDGGPSMQWNRRFFQLMVGALKETVEESDKFELFAKEVFTTMLALNEPKVQVVNEALNRMMVGLEDETPAVRTLKAGKIKDRIIMELVKEKKHELRENVRAYINSAIGSKVDEVKKNLFPSAWGHGRFDALGRGGNLFLADLHPDNQRQASGPVSVPKIWDAWKYDWVQWNGSISQSTGRNIGEAIGVRANLVIDVWESEYPNKKVDLFIETSVNLKNIVALEQQIRKLKPPTWPTAIFGEYDKEKAKLGKKLYQQHCVECHVPKDRNGYLINPDVKNNFGLTPFEMTLKEIRTIGTDPIAALNFNSRTVKTGRLKKVIGKEVLSAAEAVEWLTTGVRETLLDDLVAKISNKNHEIKRDIDMILEQVRASSERYLDFSKKDELLKDIVTKSAALKKKIGEECNTALLHLKASDDLSQNVCVLLELVKQEMGRRNIYRDPLKYIARTNAGIWGTAPFLHNGSVANLYQLLSPVSRRDTKFCLGNLEFDPVHIGFVTKKPPCVPFVEFEFDTTLLGNSNQGHEFRNLTSDEEKIGKRCDAKEMRPSGVLGCKLAEKDRLALIEYLKTLDCTYLTLECTSKGHERI